MIIAVDTAGGDYAPHEIVKGAIKAAQEHEVEIALVGRKNILHVLAGRSLRKQEGITIIQASQTIEPDESPMKAIRSKPKSSIVVGINLLKKGEASAFVSAGNTGAVLCAALLSLGKVKGIERPAIGCFLDSIGNPALLVDAGANVDCRPDHLVQFARMGSTYSQHVLGIESPRISLLSNGTEASKGNRLMQNSYRLLQETNNLNFIGNIEAQDLLKRTTDVIVTDGFTGNIVIKTIEGMNDSFISSARQIGHVFSSAYRLRGRDLLRDIGLGSWVKRMDFSEYGGACLLGVNGNVIIAHGRSQAKAIKNAIGLAKVTAEQNIAQKINGG